MADKALRYDLTVPFARYVVQHQNEIAFPLNATKCNRFGVLTAHKKVRFREFYQCDADVVGSDSLWQEVELLHLYDAAFTKLGLPTTIKINNRKILAGMAKVLGIKDQFISFTVAIDKLDKVGPQGVLDEMANQGISSEAVTRFGQWLEAGMTLDALKEVLAESEEGKLGLEELEFVLTNSKSSTQSSKIGFDFTLGAWLELLYRIHLRGCCGRSGHGQV